MTRRLAVTPAIKLALGRITRLHLGIEPPAITSPGRHIYLDAVGTRRGIKVLRRPRLVSIPATSGGFGVSPAPWRRKRKCPGL